MKLLKSILRLKILHIYDNDDFHRRLFFSWLFGARSDHDLDVFQKLTLFFAQEMLKDKVRTLGYKHAIMDNPQLFKDKVLLINLPKVVDYRLLN